MKIAQDIPKEDWIEIVINVWLKDNLEDKIIEL